MGLGWGDTGCWVFLPVWALKSDTDFLVKHYHMPGHWTSHFPCTSCPCNDDEESLMKWSNFAPEAPWKSLSWPNNEVWKAHALMVGKKIHLLFKDRAEGGLGLPVKCHFKDVLHVGCLGLTGHVNGNVCYALTYGGKIPGASAKERMDKLWDLIQEEYSLRDTSYQFGHLSLASFTDVDKPHAVFPSMGGKGPKQVSGASAISNLE